MHRKYSWLIASFLYFINPATAQTGPWAKYDSKMKGEALVRESDGGYLKEVQSILEGGGNVNWRMEPSGLTPLMAASSGGYVEVVKLLLNKGADPNMKDINGRTALQRAQLSGAKEVVAVLNGLTKTVGTVTPPEPAKPAINPPIVKNATTTKDPANKDLARKPSTSSWASFGTYSVGQKVKFFAGSWKEGTVIEVGSAGNYAIKNVAPKERKYLIAREGAPNWNEWIDWGSVTGMNREVYWTHFFLGEWKLGETMAVNTRTNSVNQRDEYSFHAATEALTINENKTYQWKTLDRKIVTGTWKAADDGAGIILLNGYRGSDWVLRNETNAAEENIRGLQSARLTTPGKMSITAKRPL